MIDDKDRKKIETMKKAGEILGQVMAEIIDFAKEGVSELDVDKLAERRILELGGEPGFKKVEGYKYTICASTNDVVVHGIPKDRKLKEGDVFGFDCGVYLDGFHTDMAETIRIKNHLPTSRLTAPAGWQVGESRIMNHDRIDKFLDTGKKALFEAIKQARPGSRVGHISKTIQEIVEESGYGVVRSLVGHGVGRELHEDPEIPGYLEGAIEKTPMLTPGMTIAVEVIYSMGKPDVVFEGSDDWTIVTEDASLAGLFERTVAVTEEGPELITKLLDESVN